MKDMAVLSALSESPFAIVLVKWTALLVMAWVVHGCLRRRDARWRVTLWRSVLGIGLLLPLLAVVPLPLWKLAVLPNIPSQELSATKLKPAVEPRIESSELTILQSSPARASSPPTSEPVRAPAPPLAARWPDSLLLVWSMGVLAGSLRLLALGWELSRLRRNARPAEALQGFAEQVATDLSVRRHFEVRISEKVRSPFVSGIFRPMIVLPKFLESETSRAKWRAVLRHEIAHLRHNDLLWSIAWRWIGVLFWFHPLVWKVPAVHNLACEQEADRLAAGEGEERSAYAQLLAQVAVSALSRGSVPPVETKLTLNGVSQIVRRLKHLHAGNFTVWKRRDSAAAFALAAILALLSAGWEFSTANAADSLEREPREWKEAVVIVKDEVGKPIAGATIEPYSFRVKGVDSASAHNWLTFGPRLKHSTDSEGKVRLKYPVVAYPDEKQLTGKLNLIAAHPDYATEKAEISVDDAESSVRLVRGGFVEVSAYYGSERKPVHDIVAKLSGDPPPQWMEVRKGVLKCGQLREGDFMLQVMGKLPTGEIVHSEGRPFSLGKGETKNLAVELRPGIRLEGRIDNKVPRPVRHGRVVIAVRPKEFPALPVVEDFYKAQNRYGYFRHWSSYRPIADDGTFVFESLPPGEVDVIVQGDGFISQNGPVMKNRINGELVDGPPFGFPQAFPLIRGVTKIEVATEAAVTLRVRAKTISGDAVEGATVHINPNVMRIGGIFGELPKPGEEPFQEIELLPQIQYSAVTDDQGEAVLRNVPAFLTMLDITHPEFQVPLREPHHGRTVRFRLTPGGHHTVEVVLERKGRDFIGEIKHSEP